MSAPNNEIYGIGESVFVQVDGKHYSGIVKNVGYGSDDDDDDSDNNEDGGGGAGKISYEVEFSDGEIWDVDPEDMFKNEDDD